MLRDQRNRLDPHLVLLFANSGFVIIGYGMETALGYGDIIKIFRLILLLFSLFLLLHDNSRSNYILNKENSWVVNVLLLLLFVVLPFSSNFNHSLVRFLSLAPFLIYLNLLMRYLFRTYDQREIKLKSLAIFRYVYLLPLLVYFTSPESLSRTNIYGESDTGFVSNHYGWAATIFLVTTIDRSSNLRKLGVFSILFLCFALVLLVISGARSAYLCFGISVIFLVINNRSIKWPLKLSVIAASIIAVNFYLAQEDSALNIRYQKTLRQLEEGEIRAETANLALNTLKINDHVFFLGVGFDNFKDGLQVHSNSVVDIAAHNSYLEVFINNGIFVFAFFTIFFVLNAIVKFIKYDLKNYIFFPSIMIIPYFESNFGAGQFLFFPWMFFLIYYIQYSTIQKRIESNK